MIVIVAVTGAIGVANLIAAVVLGLRSEWESAVLHAYAGTVCGLIGGFGCLYFVAAAR